MTYSNEFKKLSVENKVYKRNFRHLLDITLIRAAHNNCLGMKQPKSGQKKTMLSTVLASSY